MRRTILSILVFLVFAGLAFDMIEHPKAYFGGSRPGPQSPSAPPPPAPAPTPPLSPAVPESIPAPPKIMEPSEARELSPPAPREVEAAIREGRLAPLVGKRVAWNFVDCSPFYVLQETTGTGRGAAFLPVRDASGTWFAFEANGIVASKNPSEIRERLVRGVGRVEGRIEGSLPDGFVGPGWIESRILPRVVDVRLSFLPLAPPVPQADGIAPHSTPLSPPPSPTPTREESSSSPTMEFTQEIPPTPEPTPPRYEIELVPERERAGAHAAGKEFAWSLRHTLYENDGWVLEEREYRLVEEWDRAIRSRFRTFENPRDRQAIVHEFVHVLGEDKATRAGILFNDGRGLPMYRWPPNGTRRLSLARDRAGGGDTRPERELAAPREPSAEEDRISTVENRDLRKSSRAARERLALEDQVLSFLFEASDRAASILLEAPGGARYLVKGLAQGEDISLGDKERRYHELVDWLETAPHASVVFRLKYPLFDRIALKFGPPENRRSSPYPREPKLSGAEWGEVPPSAQPTSLVWDAYGGVEVARARQDEEGDPLSDKMVLVRIDVPKWRRLRR